MTGMRNPHRRCDPRFAGAPDVACGCHEATVLAKVRECVAAVGDRFVPTSAQWEMVKSLVAGEEQ